MARFLRGLSLQTYSDFELIVVDQNADDRMLQILSKYPAINATHLVAEAGLSRSRNVGLSAAKGASDGFSRR